MIVQEIRSILGQHKNFLALRMIGSSAYNLVIENGDIDLVLLFDEDEDSREDVFTGCYNLRSDDEKEAKRDEIEEMDVLLAEIRGESICVGEAEGTNAEEANLEMQEIMETRNEIMNIELSEIVGDGNELLRQETQGTKAVCTEEADLTSNLERQRQKQKENKIINFMNERSTYISQNSLFEIADLFKYSIFTVENILINATFPIIKLKAKTSNIRIDLSLNQYSAIENTNLIARTLAHYPFVKQTIVLVKTICGIFNINCSYTCTLSSYAITLMTIFYFQITCELPHIFSKNKSIVQEFDIFDNLRGFFFFYGWLFDFENDVISVRLGKLIKKKQFRFKAYNEKYNLYLCVEDPIVSDFNVTRTVTKDNLDRIVKVFKIVFYMLSNYNTSFL